MNNLLNLVRHINFFESLLIRYEYILLNKKSIGNLKIWLWVRIQLKKYISNQKNILKKHQYGLPRRSERLRN